MVSSSEIEEAMTFDPFAPFEWQLAHDRSLQLGLRGVLMGILNVTPDSFSDGGKLAGVDAAVRKAHQMHRAGAVIVDIGGESTRPGAEEITAIEEQRRILPVIEELASHADLLLSVDTWRAETAELAVAAGAHIINDVWGLQKDEAIAAVAARSRAGVVAMHTGRERTKISDVIADQIAFLSRSLEVAGKSGITQDAIVLDPGFGFAKDTDENMELLARLEELFILGQPLLSGTSRKRFVGAVTGRGVTRRDVGTAATTVVARMKGCAIIRVHDVPKNRDALRIADGVLAATKKATVA
jgi:dihydropteroate synthase